MTLILSPGHWRIVDEELFATLVIKARGNQIAYDQVSLRPTGDRLN